jgi:hypothetical protein
MPNDAPIAAVLATRVFHQQHVDHADDEKSSPVDLTGHTHVANGL